MDILYHALIPVLLREIPVIRFIHNRLAVTEMIVAYYIITVSAHIFGEFMVTLNILYHAVTDLQHSSDFPARRPLYGMDLRPAVSGRIIKFFSHLSSILT